MGEKQRILIDHFRPVIGHYYWQLFVQGKVEDAFKAIFGDHVFLIYGERVASTKQLSLQLKTGEGAHEVAWVN